MQNTLFLMKLDFAHNSEIRQNYNTTELEAGHWTYSQETGYLRVGVREALEISKNRPFHHLQRSFRIEIKELWGSTSLRRFTFVIKAQQRCQQNAASCCKFRTFSSPFWQFRTTMKGFSKCFMEKVSFSKAHILEEGQKQTQKKEQTLQQNDARA